jgi:ubiquinone/menaquinone biosynthesis C-methylase UbiE
MSDKLMTAHHTDREVGTHYESRARAEGLAQLYDEPTPLGSFYRDRLGRIAELLGDAEGDLLDAGCGTGQMLRYLRDRFPDRFALYGLDRSTAVIEVATSVLDDPEIRLRVGRMEELPYPRASFDVVLTMGSLEYVAVIDEALAELARVTRPGGLAIVTMQNRWSPYRLWDATVSSRLRRRRGQSESPVVHRLAERRLRDVLAAVGFSPRSVVRYGFRLLPAPLESRLPKLAAWTQRSIEHASRGRLGYLATDYIVVARREAELATAATQTPPSATK